nr:MAG TPA: hypothetical protein [Caudoviricetes sp.]
MFGALYSCLTFIFCTPFRFSGGEKLQKPLKGAFSL